MVCLPRGPAASALAWFAGGELQFEPADYLPLPPIGWFSLGLEVPRVSVLSFSIVARFAPICGFCFCLTITALLVLAYSVRNHHGRMRRISLISARKFCFSYGPAYNDHPLSKGGDEFPLP